MARPSAQHYKTRPVAKANQPLVRPPRADAAVSHALTAGERIDGWANTTSGLGTSRDKARNFGFTACFELLQPRVLEALFVQDDLARTIVSALPEDAMRPGYCLTYEGGDPDPKHLDAFKRQIQSLRANERILRARIWGRLYGHGAVMVVPRGTGRAETPLPPTPQVGALITLTAEDLSATMDRVTDIMDPDFGEPLLYRLQRQGGLGVATTPTNVHRTRLLQFGGELTPPLIKASNAGRDVSVLQAVYEVLRAANGNWQGVCALFADMSQAVIKMKGLIQAIASGKLATIQARMAEFDRTRSSVRSVMIDQDNEDFQFVERGAVAGVGDLLDKSWLRVSAAARMPLTRLLGEAASGLNATGEGDKDNWYDSVRTEQKDELEPRIVQVLRWLAPSCAPGTDPEAWGLRWNPLDEPTPTETAALRKSVAETDAIYIDKGVLAPAEVAISRFGGTEYSTEYVIDTDAHQAQLDAEIAAMKAGPDETDPEADPNADPEAEPTEDEPANKPETTE